MPDQTPPTNNPPASDKTNVDTTRKQQPHDPGSQAKMPHEKDQSVGETSQEPSPEMEQAHADLKRGLVDTDARAPDGRPKGSKHPAG
ncbi:hypothetical protein [Comamonas sp. MYb396]|uniref:hypothetical protein n=1 Tax=Comamonas sp. MYb396 TaxID=2745302 RepID=UPI0028A8FA53|nr:hypothetical protein [Comamonas koreensis]